MSTKPDAPPEIFRATREDRELRFLDHTGRERARALLANPLTDPDVVARWIDQLPAGIPGAIWTGWLEDDDGSPTETHRGLYPSGVRTWTGPGRAALDEALPTITKAAKPLLIRAHARHVIADPQTVLSTFRGGKGLTGWCPERGGASDPTLSFVFEPTAFLTPDMLRHAEDHLARSFEALPIQPWCWGTLLTGAELADAPWGSRELVPTPITRGVVPGDLLANSWARSAARRLPTVLLDDDFDAQVTLLRDALAQSPAAATSATDAGGGATG